MATEVGITNKMKRFFAFFAIMKLKYKRKWKKDKFMPNVDLNNLQSRRDQKGFSKNWFTNKIETVFSFFVIMFIISLLKNLPNLFK